MEDQYGSDFITITDEDGTEYELEVLATTDARPAAVIGIPVGFVGAAESKEALRENPFGLEYLVVRGRRGGSAVTCAAVNAMASQAEITNDSTLGRG